MIRGYSILSVKEREWAYQKWCEGYTRAEIADALNVCPKTVQRAIGHLPKVKPVLVYTGEKENGSYKR